MRNLKGFTPEELKVVIEKMELESYRADQIMKWLYQRGVEDFSKMTNLSMELRKKLKDSFSVERIKCINKLKSEDDTEKFLFQLNDGERIESVYIPEGDRRTLCISSQVGCGMGCKFCATGKIGFLRNLEVWEIIEQILRVEEIKDTKISNIVIMGMGEPLSNTENVIKSIKIMNVPMEIGARKITLSTAGIVPEIYRIAEIPIQFRLALSLNASTDSLRKELMPVAEKYNIEELIKAGKYYANKKNMRTTIEYILFKGINDSKEDAVRLGEISRKLPCKINIIPYNPVDNTEFRRPSKEKIESFRDYLYPIAPSVTVRWSKGKDSSAACGQLSGGYQCG